MTRMSVVMTHCVSKTLDGVRVFSSGEPLDDVLRGSFGGHWALHELQ